jgi:nucleoside-diphosphate-sugar epimerase
MRVAVTGAAGYLGRPLVAALAGDPRVERLTAIDLRPPPPASGAVLAVARDVRDPGLIEDLRGCDVLVHLAFRVLGRGEDADSVNVEGSRNAFAAAAGAGVGAIVHASSSAAYGCRPENPVPLTEESALHPEPPFYYPRTKVGVERVLDELGAREPHLRIVRMRPVSVVGAGAPRLPGGARAFLSLSDYDPLMQFLWLDDLVAGFLAAIHSDAAGPFNLGAPDPVSSSEVAGLLGVRRVRAPYRALRAAARAASAARLPGALHPGWVDMARYPIVVDCARAQRELGWRASCDTAEALRRFGRLRREPAAPAAAEIPVPEEVAR